MRIKKIGWMAALLAGLCGGLPLLAAPVPAAYAAEAAKAEDAAALEPVVIGSVVVGSESYIELGDVRELENSETRTVAFTVAYDNRGGEALDLRKIRMRLLSASGGSYQAQPVSGTAPPDTIPAGVHQELRYYAQIDKDVQLSQLLFTFVQLDFSAAGYERKLGELQVPEAYSSVTPAGAKQHLVIAGTPFNAKLDRAYVSQNSTYLLPSLYVDLENVGSGRTKLPELSFAIRTKDGHSYPLQSADFTKDRALDPLDAQEGLLTGAIPRAAGTDGWQLIVTQTVAGADGKSTVSLPLAAFDVPPAQAHDVSLGNDYDFVDQAGTYSIRLDTLERLPWEDDDILAASLTLMNKGTEALPIPELKGQFTLDDAVTIEGNVIRSDKVISLLPGKSVTIGIAGKIPYVSDFEKLDLTLQEPQGEKRVDLLTFHHNEALTHIKSIPLGEKRMMTDTGRQAAYQVRDVQTFEGDSADLLLVQVEAENLEKRFTDLRKQVAQLQTADGTVFPATIGSSGRKVIPGGKALLSVWALAPKGAKTEGLQLILGDAVTLPGTAGVAADGYMNAALFALPAESKTPKADFADLEAYPYTISLSHIGTQIDFVAGTAKLSFDYDLKKDALIDADMKDQSLIVELRDETVESGKEIVISETYALDGTSAAASKSLELGFHDATMTYTNKDALYKIKDFSNYRLNIYHQFQNGYKQLLATKELDWFIYTD
ncbi:hypothetical protein ABE504_14930 [Paenibacillus oryzisoli]|uniref:hypothetical protein n=1 Tax=Paenibacillus oryzisoli TaxID=1850517 RepID=UPI003D2C76DC